MTYNVFGGALNLTQLGTFLFVYTVPLSTVILSLSFQDHHADDTAFVHIYDSVSGCSTTNFFLDNSQLL